MQRLEVGGSVRPLKWPLGVKWLILAYFLNLSQQPPVDQDLLIYEVYRTQIKDAQIR
jgi:hypothetical protein